MDPQLLDFIRKAKGASETDEEIRSSLASAGWEPQEIEQVFASFQNSANSAPTSAPSLPQTNIMKASLGKFIVPLVVVVVLLVVGITAGYVLLKSPPKTVVNPPKSTPTGTSQDKPSVASVSPRVISPTSIQGQPIMVNNTRNILAYTETPQQDKPPSLVFYDVAKKQKLPPDPVIEADKNYMIQLGPWSPNGQYLPILAYTGPASEESNINLYLFDSKTLTAKKIYNSPSNEENRLWANTSFNFIAAWIDEEKLVLKDDRNSQGVLTNVTCITTRGEIITTEHSNELERGNKQLEYSFSLGALGHTVTSIKVGTNILAFVPEGEIVGVINGMLAVLTKPKPVSLSEMSDPNQSSDIAKQLAELQRQGLTEEELSKRMLELMEPKGDTLLKFYNLTNGSVEKEINLTDDTWQIQSILVHPSQKTLVAHQTNKFVQATKQRFISVDPSSESGFRIIFEEDLNTSVSQQFLSLLMFQGSSFFMSTDGESTIGMRGSALESASTNNIYIKNIANGKEDIICPFKCFDMRVSYPYHLETRY